MQGKTVHSKGSERKCDCEYGKRCYAGEYDSPSAASSYYVMGLFAEKLSIQIRVASSVRLNSRSQNKTSKMIVFGDAVSKRRSDLA
jgi:hypothetical protein